MTELEYDNFPQEVKAIVDTYDDNENLYEECHRIQKELENDDFVWYINEFTGKLLMFRKSNNLLVSDNYFAQNDLFERMIEIANGREDYIYLNPNSVRYLDEYKESFAKCGKIESCMNATEVEGVRNNTRL